MDKPTARAAGLVALSGAVTVISICISPWWNLSVSSCLTLADSEVGSWNPLEDRLLATGTPKIPDASITNVATAMTQRGAAIASNAIRCSTVASSLYPRTQDQRQFSPRWVNCVYEIRPRRVQSTTAKVGGTCRYRSTKLPRCEQVPTMPGRFVMSATTGDIYPNDDQRRCGFISLRRWRDPAGGW